MGCKKLDLWTKWYGSLFSPRCRGHIGWSSPQSGFILDSLLPCVGRGMTHPLVPRTRGSNTKEQAQQLPVCSLKTACPCSSCLAWIWRKGQKAAPPFFFKYSPEYWRLKVTGCQWQRDVQLPHDHRLLPRTVKQNDKSWFPVPLIYTFWPLFRVLTICTT